MVETEDTRAAVAGGTGDGVTARGWNVALGMLGDSVCWTVCRRREGRGQSSAWALGGAGGRLEEGEAWEGAARSGQGRGGEGGRGWVLCLAPLSPRCPRLSLAEMLRRRLGE